MELFVPGKLFLAGEYAVLEEGQPCVVLPVSRGIHVTLESSMKNQLTTDLFPGKSFSWHYNPSKNALEGDVAGMPFIRYAIEVTTLYTLENRGTTPPASIELKSTMYDEKSGKKLGLGSSAAVTVAVIEGLCQYYGMDVSKEELFKLAYIAHYMEQESGSGADIATSAYKTCIRYIAPEKSFFSDNVHKLNGEKRVSELIEAKWPLLSIQGTQWKSSLILMIGWTGEVRKTHGMIQRYHTSKKRYRQSQQEFLIGSQKSVEMVWHGLMCNRQDEILAGVDASYQTLRRMTQQYQIPYMNVALEQLVDDLPVGSYGKPSGAGGGDCGIALIPDQRVDKKDSGIECILKQWCDHHIYPLEMAVYSK